MFKKIIPIFVTVASFWSHSVLAQGAFPTKSVQLVVPFAPGGSADISARILAEQLTRIWQKPVVIDNKPGANGAIAAAMVARAPADGHTILYAPVSIGTVKLFVKNPGFDPVTDLQPVTQVAKGEYVLVARNDLPVKTISEFADYAKKNPGKVFHGSFGGGSLLAFHQLSSVLDFSFTNVPYRGESLAINDMLGGQIQVMFGTVTSTLPFIESGKIKALGLLSKSRSKVLPGVPSADESGTKGFYADFWFGLMVPAGTSAETVTKINTDARSALEKTEVKARLFANGLAASPTTVDAFAKIVKHESERWVETAKRAGVQAQ